MSEHSDTFRPAPGLRSPHLQSLLNSSALRRWVVGRRAAPLKSAQQEWLLSGGPGVRLVGHYSPQRDASRGLAVLLHGWEGSSQSNYILATGARLYGEGYDVFRLNFRDHGETHHLNEGIFHSCRLDEVIAALADMQRRGGFGAWALIGFSLGGNFALRVALHGARAGLDIRRTIAVCPVLNPANVLRAMEQGRRFYENYYVRKWARSMRIKQAHFPNLYEYDHWHRLPGLRERTRFMATRYYGYATLEQYFDGYAIDGERLAALAVPSLIVTAADDPVVPVADTQSLPANPLLELLVTRHGGHCGYISNWKLQSWVEDLIVRDLQDPA